MNSQNQITNETAVDWIRKNQKDILPPDWHRQKFYAKLGIVHAKNTLQMDNEFQNDAYFINFFTASTNDKVRERFYNKLVTIGIMKDTPSMKHQNLFIFDWDDTILCTSYLKSFQYLDIPQQTKNVLEKLDDTSVNLLQKCVQKEGQIYIITNAVKGWVQHSSKLFLPKVLTLIKNKNIKVISARSLFSEQYPGDYAQWKVQAFKSILNNFNTNMITNLIVIGDNNIQIQAAQSLGKQFQQSLVKTVKFKQSPKPDQLIKQQELVCDRMKQIYSTPKNLTIRLQRKQQKTQQQSQVQEVPKVPEISP